MPVVAAPSPRVLWAALEGEVGLAVWLRNPVPPLVRQVKGIVHGPEFVVVAQGTPAELETAVQQGLPRPRRAGPLETDVAILAGLYAQLTGCSALQLDLQCVRSGPGTALQVGKAPLTLLCCYGGPGVEWQDAAGTVRRMPPSHAGLFKGSDWPDDAIRTPYRLPAVPPGAEGRLLLRLDRIPYA